MKKYLIRFSLLVATFLLTGCATPFSSQKTELNLNDEKSELVIENDIENSEEAQENQEKSAENTEEESQENEVALEKNNNSTENTTEEKASDESVSAKFEINDELASWGFSKASNRTIDTIIIHSSYNAVGSDLHNLDDIIYKEYKPYGVSPHYIISREGKVYRLVEDKNIAYHAGESKMPDGRTGVNNFSIGIEIVNTKSEKPNDAQYSALRSLIAYLKGKYKIKYVLGHSDIASGRKDDPWNFDFSKIK